MLGRLRFEGAPAVVTGGGTGIGRACCEALAELGATVVVCGRTEATLRETEAAVRAAGADCIVSVTDVTDEAAVAALAEGIAGRFGFVKALINNAGDNFRAKATELAAADWQRILDVDLNAVFYTTRAFLPALAAAPVGGAIVNNASTFGLVANPAMPAYCAAKGAVISLTHQLALDYAADGVRVNAVCPGPTLSPRIRSYIERGQTSAERLAGLVPLGRMAECEEIAAAMVFLASDAASYVTGATLPVDGGYTIR